MTDSWQEAIDSRPPRRVKAAAFGGVAVIPPQPDKAERGAVCVVALYGPRGGYIGDVLLDRGAAEETVRKLSAQLDAERLPRKADCTVCDAKTGEPMCRGCDEHVRRGRMLRART